MSTQLSLSPGCVHPYFYLLFDEYCRSSVLCGILPQSCNQLQTQIIIPYKQTKINLKSVVSHWIPTFAAAQCWDEAPCHYILCLFMLCLKQ